MANEDDENKNEELSEEEKKLADEAAAKKKKKKMLFIIIGVVLLLVIGGGAAAFFMIGNEEAENLEKDITLSDDDEDQKDKPASLFFVQIPEVIVNLRAANQKDRGNILRATFLLQLYDKKDEPKIREAFPIIIDQILSYLRDQSVTDLSGPGLERMRQALLIRINGIIKPSKVHHVTIKDFIIQ